MRPHACCLVVDLMLQQVQNIVASSITSIERVETLTAIEYNGSLGYHVWRLPSTLDTFVNVERAYP